MEGGIVPPGTGEDRGADDLEAFASQRPSAHDVYRPEALVEDTVPRSLSSLPVSRHPLPADRKPADRKPADRKPSPPCSSVPIVLTDPSPPGSTLSQSSKKGKGTGTERARSAWRAEDFAKSEEWFRDVIQLPGTGVLPKLIDIPSAELEAYFGKKLQTGYAWKPEQGSLLDKRQRAEILHLLKYTDGRAYVQNDVLLVHFAKGFYAMKKRGMEVNWAKFAAHKHKGQLDGMVRHNKPEPTPGTGIRDENQKYFPYVHPGDEILKEDMAGASEPKRDTFYDPSALPPPSGPLSPGFGVDDPAFNTMVETICRVAPARTPDSKLTGQSVNDTHRSTNPHSPIGGSINTRSGNYSLLHEYLKLSRDDVANAKKSMNELKVALEEQKRAVENAQTSKAKYVGDLERLKSETDKVAKLAVEKERDDIRESQKKLSDLIEDVWEKYNEAEEEDPGFLEECKREADEYAAKIKDLEYQVTTFTLDLEHFTATEGDRANAEARLVLAESRVSQEEKSALAEVQRLETNLEVVSTRLSHAATQQDAYVEFDTMVKECTGSPLSLCMVPSPIRNWSPVFQVTNCPICHLGFRACNFLPVSCGHSYHPACGLPYFQSQVEPRCKACNELIHLSWLKTWGIQPGSANIDLGSTLGLTEFEASLRREDFALRLDHEAIHELQVENSQARSGVTRVYNKMEIQNSKQLNDMGRRSLRDGFSYRRKLMSSPTSGMIPEKVVVENSNVKESLVKVKLEHSPGNRVDLSDHDSDNTDGNRDVEEVGAPTTAHVITTRSKNGVSCAKERRERKRASVVNPKAQSRKRAKHDSDRQESSLATESLTPEVSKALEDVKTPVIGSVSKGVKGSKALKSLNYSRN